MSISHANDSPEHFKLKKLAHTLAKLPIYPFPDLSHQYESSCPYTLMIFLCFLEISLLSVFYSMYYKIWAILWKQLNFKDF